MAGVPFDGVCDYAVIGSGAGGGPVAARLAEAGFQVVLLEAGGDAAGTHGGRLPEDYDVPAFHAFASENPAMRWDYFVKHHDDPALQAQDPNYVPGRGILYPRAATLGGCTAHNAMIFVVPPDEDFDAIADATGDASWRGAAMRQHLRTLEACHHRPFWRFASKFGFDPTGHGWRGWLSTERAMPKAALHDDELLRVVAESAFDAIRDSDTPTGELWGLLESHADPNDVRVRDSRQEGVWYTPLTTHAGRRVGARESVLAAAQRSSLHVELHALVTGVLFDAERRAVGVRYLTGESLFRADPRNAGAAGEAASLSVRREVIVSGGAFNTPQLLMLSGIGPGAELQRHGIDIVVDLPGVGRNLQDRYEISVVNRMRREWSALRGARFERGDPQYRAWQRTGSGMYASNGSAIAVSARSAPAVLPDLFLMALLANFRGYFPGYSQLIADSHRYLSWTILKAHTGNRAGTVTLTSADPRDPPKVDFHSFATHGDADLAAVVGGIRLARRMAQGLRDAGLIEAEELPGDALQSEAELTDFVRARAWGHHASCSCPIGARESGGVLDSQLRVHGTLGLRVADASVFPAIPGFFIASAVYLMAEKAAAMILNDTVS